jgi:hypothetical protein
MGCEAIVDEIVCGVCLNHSKDLDYYLCAIAPICRFCLQNFLNVRKDACPLCAPIKNCSYRIESYDITSYPSPVKS